MTEDDREPRGRIRSLSCFFPAFNEEENIGGVLEEALAVLPRFADEFEVIVVDDGSSDGTGEVVREYARGDERIRLVTHEVNRGYGEALRSGLNAARGDAVFFTDADRQFHLDDIARLLAAYPTSPFVVGYRLKRSDPKHRLFVARVYHAALKAVFGLRVRDVDCAFKLLDRTALDPIRPDLVSRSAFISPELLIRARMAGVSVVEVGVPHYPRAAGRPKGATPKVIARTIKEIFVMRRRLGRVKGPAGTSAGARRG
ncbi:MAG: glycosyltransferase family 2 protein [Actinomycetota bacterium]